VQPEFAALAARKLTPGGILHAATDWPDYADQIHAVLSQHDPFEKADSGLVERPTTKFERRGQGLGHVIRDLYFRRRETAPAGR
jgi:tRNA (guanine-N7-)-methyltransferase